MKDLRVISLKDWKVNYTEFGQWINDSDVTVHAIAMTDRHGGSIRYGFESEEDFIAFKLKFERTEESLQSHLEDFFETGNPNTNYS